MTLHDPLLMALVNAKDDMIPTLASNLNPSSSAAMLYLFAPKQPLQIEVTLMCSLSSKP